MNDSLLTYLKKIIITFPVIKVNMDISKSAHSAVCIGSDQPKNSKKTLEWLMVKKETWSRFSIPAIISSCKDFI